MAMLRALSVRNHRRYERLEQPIDDPEVSLLGSKLPRTTSVPAQFLSRKLTPASAMPSNSQAKSTKKSKSHPLFSLFNGRRHRRKTTAKPEFARYLEYVKEGAVWDRSSNMPVIYYK
ncbi:hypothetical protein SLEP1_g7973 [Rubroshorea leprosula]|uniref:Uncharacterized protein n=1 Tax=Rubroshorea leprosula TaxID=152421 RepID=A0AAV5I029_9ROSI|nr:hypothetical protein SLEP1_g7973 [Rubroshorea leprosula]